LEYLTKAYASQPDNVTWLYNIAIAEGQLGKIDEEKKDLQSIIDNPQVDQAYKQTITELINSLNQQASSSEANIKQKPQSVPSGWKQFTSTAMNLTFAYPQTFRLKQISAQLVSLSDPAHPTLDDELLIYATQLSVENLDKIPVVFHITGQLKESQPIQFPGFQAVGNVYTDTAGQTQLLLLKQGQQIFAIRFPKEEDLDKKVLNKIVLSIATLH